MFRAVAAAADDDDAEDNDVTSKSVKKGCAAAFVRSADRFGSMFAIYN